VVNLVKDLLRKAAGTLAQGFLFGVGLAVAAWGVYYLAYGSLMAQAMNSAPDYAAMTGPGTAAATLRKEIVLSDVEERKEDGRVSVIGKLTNNGSRSASGLQIQVDLFNKGKFVDQYSSYISGAVGAGETRYFKVACGCKDTPPAEHDSFKTQVLGGY
jgi:hypothetical protein